VSIRFWISVGLLASATLLRAQATPTASRIGDLQVGIGYGIAQPDYTTNTFKGIVAYSAFDFTSHFGVEFDFRLLNGPGSTNLYEKTYEFGGRYHRTYGRLSPYGKVMVGRGVFNFQNGIANLAYNMGALGAGVDYRIKPYLSVRGDFEYQHWMGFPPHGLSPMVESVGVAYHFR
jgi:hypothetical protein